MPHPERAAEALLGSDRRRDAVRLARSLVTGRRDERADRDEDEPAIDRSARPSEHGLSRRRVRARPRRSSAARPTYTELGIFSVMWSEHCSYKSSRVHLRKLPTKGPRVIQGPGENAGVVDIGDGFAVVFKMESHNHPSFIEPYQGAATGVGGILRDVFTMGARPDRLPRLAALRPPRSPARRATCVEGVVAGIGGYGNAFGVPTVGGEVHFDASLRRQHPGQRLHRAASRAPTASSTARAAGVGNPVLYFGAKTGRDGIHGATMASAEFDEAVRVEAPDGAGRRSLHGEAAPRGLPRAHGARTCLVGIQDMGAAG